EAEALRQHHAAYFLLLAEQAEPELTGPLQAIWFARLEGEHDNMRAALQWALGRRAGGVALGLAGALWRFWYTHGHLSDGRRWLESALALADAAPDDDALLPGAARARASRMEAWAKALTGAGVVAWVQGEYRRAHHYYADALSLYRELKDRAGVAQM